jgi:ABC-2 type transport system permease protein
MKIFAATIKELILLKRDRTGLLILFMMPAFLVIVITLVQENVMELTGQKKTQVVFLDIDGGTLGSSLSQQLSKGNAEIIFWDSSKKNASELQKAVTDGKFQVGIIIEEGSSATFLNNVAQLFRSSDQAEQKAEITPVPISVFFDPGVMPGFRSGLTAHIQLALQAIAVKAKVENLALELNSSIEALGLPEEYTPVLIKDLSERLEQPIVTMEVRPSGDDAATTPPYNPVQQNVPAWAIFGMFFTAIPIAGTILQERKSGIWIRLSSLPVSHLQLFCGKALAYVGVCLCQFVLIGLIGFFVFPYLGLPAFTFFHSLAGVIFTILFISFAACGFGIFLGIICSSYEQASALGACCVVTAAAIGGVMVPVYAMPRIMQQLSIVSPLNWGLTAFQDLLVRGHSFTAIADDLGRLMIFFLVTVIFAWKLSRTRI